jgi:hypothetical protein
MPHAVTYRRALGQAIDIQELDQVIGAFFGRCQHSDEQLAMDGRRCIERLSQGNPAVNICRPYVRSGGASFCMKSTWPWK